MYIIGYGVARGLSLKYQTLTVIMSVAQNTELFTHALSGITIMFIPGKEPKCRTVRLNTGHLATLLEYNISWKPHDPIPISRGQRPPSPRINAYVPRVLWCLFMPQ